MMILVTGGAGFIGFHVVKKRLEMGDEVILIDNLNAYYEVSLKQARLAQLGAHPNLTFIQMDITDRERVADLFNTYPIEGVIHLAAQVGVRYSLQQPMDYVDANVLGFSTILEACRHHAVKHLVYASTSSVYGGNQTPVFSETDPVDQPLTIYAATKRYNELAAQVYSNLYQLRITGLRFFSVYGPWSRPDLALFKFTKSILEDRQIDVYNHGDMLRDFTYVDDVVEGVSRIFDQGLARAKEEKCFAEIYNIGHGEAVPLMRYIQAIESAVGKQANIRFLPMQEGEMYSTCSDVRALFRQIHYQPAVQVEEGVAHFVKWYQSYYKMAATL